MAETIHIVDPSFIPRFVSPEGWLMYGKCRMLARRQCPNYDPITESAKCGRCNLLNADWEAFETEALARAHKIRSRRSLGVRLDDWVKGVREPFSAGGEVSEREFRGSVFYKDNSWVFTIHSGRIGMEKVEGGQ